MHVVIRLMEKLQAHGALRVAKKSRRRKKDKKNTENKTVGDDATGLNGIQPSSNDDLPPNTGNCDKERSTQRDCDEKEETINGHSQVYETKLSSDERQNSGGSLPVADHGESDQILDPIGDGESNQMHEPLGDNDESNQINDDFVVMGADDCDSSADEQLPATNEVDFNMTPLLLSLATSTIISNLCWLLKFYKSNSTATNHYVLCLLRRISDDLDLAPMLYQLSCLAIFYDILDEQKTSPRKECENIVEFLTSLVRRMLRKMRDQPLLFVDLLFWKTRKDCHYINVESIQREVGEMKKEVKNWGHVDETGPSQGKEYTNKKSLADALGDDEYDVSIPNQSHLEKDEDSDEAAGEDFHSYGREDNIIIEDTLDNDPQGVKKKKRRLVLSDKLEEEIRGLHEKYKDNLNCNQLIAEALDPDGNISPAQVSRKCKKLGLQLPSKRSSNMAHLSNDNDQDKEGRSEIDISLQDLNHADGPSYLGRPTQARKRVRAMDEKQELKIRSLFEQFKDHKRCSHMIAKELDPDGVVTAAQVSRKLKKLGLRTSRMKSEVNKEKMDEASTDGDDDSDNLTLSAVRKRSKNKLDASSDKELGSSKHDDQSPGSNSDDELPLGSILKKVKRVRTEPEDKCVDASTNQEDNAGEDSSNQIAQTLAERNEIREAMDVNVDVQKLNTPHRSSAHEAAKSGDLGEGGNQQKNDELFESVNGASNRGSPSNSQEIDATPDTRLYKRGFRQDDDVDSVQNVLKYSELEDSGDDEQAFSVSPESSLKRRKHRIVMDFDDDDDDDE
ncbi:hypothetical protein SOVF_106000 [Spinacia oleracea]|nr:hypothetical protein SOVF_106000 [Spinacia oleracea]